MRNSIYVAGGCFTIIIIICIALIFDALLALGGMALWNWLAPLFWKTAPILTFWQAFGIFILLSIIAIPFKRNNSK